MPDLLPSRSELLLALRWMRRQPVTTATAVLALAVGIGLAAVAAAVFEATLFAELPFENGDRFVRIRAHQEPGGQVPLDPDRFLALREGATSFAHLGELAVVPGNVRHPDGSVEPVEAIALTPDSFAFLPGSPLRGRTLLPEDAEPGAPPVVVIGEGLWRRALGADPAAVGSRIEVSGDRRTIVGILPRSFEFPAGGEIWLPREVRPAAPEASAARPVAFGILRDEVPIEAAGPEAAGIADRFAVAGEPELRVEVVPYTEPPPGWRPMISSLVGGLVLLLLVVAANVANLFVARTAGRTGELAVRTALGATRKRLVGQLLLEILVLGSVAAALGLGGAIPALDRLETALGPELPFWIDFSPGPGSLAFVVALTLAACAVAGIAPALRATRRDPVATLRERSPGGGGGLGRGSGAAIVAEVAVSVALLSTALVVARGLTLYAESGRGPLRDRVLTLRVGEGDAAGPATKDELVRALGALPEVEAVGLGTALPRTDPPLRRTLLVDAGDGLPEEPIGLPVVEVGPGYFAALGSEVLEGRELRPGDLAPGAAPVALVNRSFVAGVLAGRRAPGRGLVLADESPAEEHEIVGVVPDLALSAADPSRAGGWYVPLRPETRDYYVALRTRGVDPMALEVAVRRAVADVDPRIFLYRFRPLGSVGRDDEVFLAGLAGSLSALGGLATLLSLAGLYAMMSCAVAARRREVGIRRALGAPAGAILRHLFGRAGTLLAIGAGVGVVGATLLLRARELLVVRLPAGELSIVPAVVGLVVLAGLAAAWSPARRALAVRPADALRSD